MTAVELLCQGTIRAAWQHLLHRGIDTQTVDASELAATLRATLKENMSNILSEWEDATKARMSESWLKELMNAQCNEMAVKALKEGGFIQ